ncbi:MAG TPA: hypothetical protein VN947_25305 [Polyangia bacterium]|nr:hypothetical protein [Polyangia bacterium]
MRAILHLLIGSLVIGTVGCGTSADVDKFELDIAVDAPQATSVVIDDKRTLPPTGAVYSQGFPSVSAAMTVHGTVETVNADGSVRAMAAYDLGSYCSGQMPLLRQTLHFAESLDGSGNPQLALGSVECEKTDGTGTIVMP